MSSMINKPLYDALITAKVSDEQATAAAESVNAGDVDKQLNKVEQNIELLIARVGNVEKHLEALTLRVGTLESRLEALILRVGTLESRLEALILRVGTLENRLAIVEQKIEVLTARVANVERLQWFVLAGILALFIRSFVPV